MKIIHCADLHLDPPMRYLPKDKAKERQAELLGTFSRMVSYAAENDVSAVIIAGDLFDRKTVSAKTRKLVGDTAAQHPDINFYYLRGNHDVGGFLSGGEAPPPNLRLFGDEWTAYDEGEVVVTGAEMTGGHGRLCSSLTLDAGRTNIVVLHGQILESTPKNPEDIDLRQLRGKGIDYLALGHVHAYRDEKLDARGRLCYPGSLESHGFDECGDRGFVLLDIKGGRVSADFVPFARRRHLELPLDVTGLNGTADVLRAANEAAAGLDGDSLVKLVLTGDVDVESETDLFQLEKELSAKFYFVRAADETRLKIDYGSYRGDVSLKGEFIRCVETRDDLTDEDKAAVIRYGIRALAGEEVLE